MKTILIVDDDNDILNALGDLMRLKGWYVVTASNGKEALQAAVLNTITVVLSDIDMPVKNGIEFLKEFRSFDKLTPVIMMSGGNDYSENELMQMGAKLFLAKPLPDLRTLLSKIHFCILDEAA